MAVVFLSINQEIQISSSISTLCRRHRACQGKQVEDLSDRLGHCLLCAMSLRHSCGGRSWKTAMSLSQTRFLSCRASSRRDAGPVLDSAVLPDATLSSRAMPSLSLCVAAVLAHKKAVDVTPRNITLVKRAACLWMRRSART